MHTIYVHFKLVFILVETKVDHLETYRRSTLCFFFTAEVVANLDVDSSLFYKGRSHNFYANFSVNLDYLS